MRSSRRAAKLRCARKSRRRNRTPTAPTAAPSRKVRATKRGNAARAEGERSPKQLPRDSRQAAKRVAEQKRPPSTSRKVNFHAAGKSGGVLTRNHDDYKREVHSERRSGPAPAHRRRNDGIQEGARRKRRRHGEGHRVSPHQGDRQGREARREADE